MAWKVATRRTLGTDNGLHIGPLLHRRGNKAGGRPMLRIWNCKDVDRDVHATCGFRNFFFREGERGVKIPNLPGEGVPFPRRVERYILYPRHCPLRKYLVFCTGGEVPRPSLAFAEPSAWHTAAYTMIFAASSTALGPTCSSP